MRRRTVLVLILATLSLSCFNLASAILAWNYPHLSAADDYHLNLVTYKVDELEQAGSVLNYEEHVIAETIKAQKKEFYKMAKAQEGEAKLSKEQAEERLRTFIKNIEAHPWFKTLEGMKYKELAKKSAEVVARTPAKTPLLMHALYWFLGSTIALLVFAGMLNLAE